MDATSEPSDNELMARVRAGDRFAFTQSFLTLTTGTGCSSWSWVDMAGSLGRSATVACVRAVAIGACPSRAI